MTPVEYFVAIDFGTASTKVLCWDVKTDKTYQIKLGKEKDDGIMPSVVKMDDTNDVIINFFDKPSNMEATGDIHVFRQFVRILFYSILVNNHFLTFNKEDLASNFLVIISYPFTWNIEEGNALLREVRGIIPVVRYAIRQEEVTFITKRRRPSIVLEFSPTKMLYKSNDRIAAHYGLGLRRIDEYMLEKIVNAVEEQNTQKLDSSLVSLIKEGKLSEVELILRELKNVFLSKKKNVLQADEPINLWFQEAINDYNQNLTTFLEIIKESIKDNPIKNVKPKAAETFTVYLFGCPLDNIESILNKVFCNYYRVDVQKMNVFQICEDMIDFIKFCYNKTISIYKEAITKLTSPDKNGQYLMASTKMVNKALNNFFVRHVENNCTNDGLAQLLKTYSIRDDRTSDKDFETNIDFFISDKLKNFFDAELFAELKQGYANILNNSVEEIIRTHIATNNTKMICISQYMDFDFTSFNYVNDYLSIYLEDEVFSKCRSFYERKKPNEPRDRKHRKDVCKYFLSYIQKGIIVDKEGMFCWAVLENEDNFKLYILDNYCINRTIIISMGEYTRSMLVEPYPIDKKLISLNSLENVINYVFDVFIKETLIKDHVQIIGNVQLHDIEELYMSLVKFDYDTYVRLKRKIGDKKIESNYEDNIRLSVFNPFYSDLYSKIIDFFELNTWEVQDLIKNEAPSYVIGHLFLIVIQKYLKYGIK